LIFIELCYLALRAFGKMKHLGDITKIHGDKIEPVDCITFGSPCQDLSIAGRRAGLAGERSGLFVEAVRIIKEMRKATNGMHPTFAVWENVPGVFSSNNGEDFRAVLEELARVEQPDTSIPRPPRGGRWSKAGAISGDGWSLAWRQLDSQYFGVAQRRKRIALIIDLGGQRAGEILFERTSLSRYPDPCIPTWQETTGAARSRIAGNDRVVAEGGRNAAYTLKIRSGCAGGGKGALVQTEKTGTLSTLQDQTLFQPVPILNDQGGGVMGVSYNVTGTLRAAEHGHQPIVFESNAQPVVLESNQIHATVTQTGICPTLSASMGMGGGYIPMVTNKAEKAIHWIVRRLTPTECERLQGYPDGWTDIGEWTDTKGKKHKPADSPRYKALGNSIALPQWFWIAQKMKPYLPADATLGSLFDGIGGFPLIWETTYGTGTAAWASEIEEFPIAVTKRRLGEE
jgi:DNA (cytosine-5)-methyltransferase 1